MSSYQASNSFERFIFNKHSIPLSASDPIKNIIWFHQAHVIPSRTPHFNKSILSNKVHLVSLNRVPSDSKLSFHQAYLILSSFHHTKIISSLPCVFLSKAVSFLPYRCAFESMAVLYNIAHPTANIRDNPNQEFFRMIHVPYGRSFRHSLRLPVIDLHLLFHYICSSTGITYELTYNAAAQVFRRRKSDYFGN